MMKKNARALGNTATIICNKSGRPVSPDVLFALTQPPGYATLIGKKCEGTVKNMRRRLIWAVLLAGLSLGILLFPWGGFYRSPLMWAERDRGGNQPVDVFLVGATADLGQDGTFLSSCWEPDDRYYQSSLLGFQELLYRDNCRIYAPYYRQVCLSVYYLPDPDRGPYFAAAYEDVRSAFLWYLDHENQGRPFLLAGYSQGADLALRLMEEFFGEESLQEQLVAAYLIGWRVTWEDLAMFPQLHMAQGAEDTGVIVSFNSEAPGITDTIILPEGGYAYGINPLNWRVDGTPADREENPGVVKIHMDGSVDQIRPQLTGCYQSPDRGTIIVPDISPEDFPPGEPLFVPGCYHNYEIELYYFSLLENVKDRVAAYLARE